jgi:hypothetical protein
VDTIMPVNFQTTVVNNAPGAMTLHPLHLMLNGVPQATLGVGDAQVLTVSFDSIRIIAAMNFLDFDQNPIANVDINPGSIATFSRLNNGTIELTYAQPGQAQQSVIFG